MFNVERDAPVNAPDARETFGADRHARGSAGSPEDRPS